MYSQIRELVRDFRDKTKGKGAAGGKGHTGSGHRAGGSSDVFDAVEEAGLIDELIDAMMSGYDSYTHEPRGAVGWHP